PEGAVVHGVYRHAAVVAPARAAGLLAAPRNERTLPLGQRIERVGDEPSGPPDGWIYVGCIGYAVPYGNVAHVVHSYAAHPPVVRARRICALLVHHGRAVRVAYLVPPDTRRAVAVRVRRLVYDQRLVAAHVPVGKPVHKAVSDRLQLDEGVGLVNASAARGRAQGN